MVKIAALPSMAIIRGFRGCLDFYEHRGQIICRRWPKKPKQVITPAVTCNQLRFRNFQQNLWAYSREARFLYKSMMSSHGWRWHDLAYKMYMGRTAAAPPHFRPDGARIPPPCPDDPGLLATVFKALWVSWRNIFGIHTLTLIFATVEPWRTIRGAWSLKPPSWHRASKKERGRVHWCGFEPYPLSAQGHTYFGNDWAAAPLHNLHWASFPVSYVQNLEQDQYYQLELWTLSNPDDPTGDFYSALPFFRLTRMDVPSPPSGSFRVRHVDPLLPIRQDPDYRVVYDWRPPDINDNWLLMPPYI